MNMTSLRKLIAFGLLLPASVVNAEIKPGALFCEGAVLQRDASIPVWGTADPGEQIQVRFRGQSVSAKSDEQGNWRAALQPEKAGGPDALVLEGKGGTVTVSNVLVGDVWLAAGQSNMAFKVKAMLAPYAPEAIAADPSLRIFTVSLQASDSPVTSVRGQWMPVDATVVPELSAVAYFFAVGLRSHLEVPVGVIVSAVGGTSVRAWSSAEAMDAAPAAKEAHLAEWNEAMMKLPELKKEHEEALAAWTLRKQQAESAGQAFDEPKPKAPLAPDSPKRPMALFNGMIHPFIPYAIRGIIWYQGETDATRLRAPHYAELLRAMIRDWRSRWANPNLPFLIVQLPVFKHEESWFHVQLAQQEVAGDSHNGMITTLDLGDETNVHPGNKSPVGERLANLALAEVYGFKFPAHAPRPSSVNCNGREVRIAFSCEPGASLVCSPEASPQGIEMAGPDGQFYPAQTRVEKNGVVAFSEQVSEPVTIRYTGGTMAQLGISDSNRLPAGPFVFQRKNNEWKSAAEPPVPLQK